MSITTLDNQPVSFNSNLNQLDSDCNCKGMPFCQLVENADITSFQFKANPVSDNLVLNGGFNSGSNWDVSGSTWTITGGKATHGAGSTTAISQSGVVYEAGKRYKLTLTISGRTQGTLSAGIGFDFQVLNTNGVHTVYLDGSVANILLAPSTDFNGSIDDISVYGLASSFTYSISDVNGNNVTDLNNYTETIVDDHVLVEFPWDYQDLSPGCYKICITALAPTNLVINGDFDDDNFWDGPVLGSELAVNGTFAVDANWTKGTGWTIAAGVATHAAGTTSDLLEISGATAGWRVKTEYTITSISAGFIHIDVGGTVGTNRLALGTYQQVLLAGGSNLSFRADTTFNGSIDNVSVKRVTEWYINAGKATHLTGNTTPLSQIGILSTGNTYRLTFTISSRTAGNITPSSSGLIGVYSTNGTYTVDIIADSNDLVFTPTSDFDGSIDDVSIYLTSEDITYCSDCFSLKESHGCSFLLSWYNIEDNFDFIYSTGYVHKMRVKGKLWKPKRQKDKKIFKFSDASRKVLYSESDKVMRFTVEEMPEYMHDALSSGIDHDYFMIGEDHYIAEPEDYEENTRNSSLLAPITIEVIKNFQPVLKNDNC